jgi:hypothetical protein
LPNYTWISQDLQGSGPVIPLLVTVTAAAELALANAQQPAPTPIQVDALIDSGASNSSIQQGLLRPLNLNPVGVVPVVTPTTKNTPHMATQYAVRLVFPQHGGGIFDSLAIMEMPLQGQNIQFLLGRDVLSAAILVYNGPAGSFTLAF